jgi:predicted RNase H-like HicB family nuclease
MRRVTVIYRWEPEGCWAESPDAPGFSGAAATFGELREQVRDGLAFYFEEPVELTELYPDLEPPVILSAGSEIITAESPLWRRIASSGTRAAGSILRQSLSATEGQFTVVSRVAHAG